MLGRPDYWAPYSHWDSDDEGTLVACEFFCQHPRWNLQVQGAPLSVYMRHDILQNQTTYIVSHKQGDTSVNALKNIINIALRTASEEAYARINKVDDHLGGLETSDRAKLSELTKQLQIISQNADSHLGNADVSIITATGIRNAHARLYQWRDGAFISQHVRDSIEYVIKSMEKQKIWFLNYKNRKDSTMSLVYNLVTQQDAANNIELAADTKRDSTSMNAIAALTMAFLPGTFTA
ncbi:MAG: hypothetical protein Q9217_006181, partial [Psora testacea]